MTGKYAFGSLFLVFGLVFSPALRAQPSDAVHSYVLSPDTPPPPTLFPDILFPNILSSDTGMPDSLLSDTLSSAIPMDFSQATIFVAAKDPGALAMPVRVLREEVRKRTGIDLPVTHRFSSGSRPVICLIPGAGISGSSLSGQPLLGEAVSAGSGMAVGRKWPPGVFTRFRDALQAMPPTGADGFKILYAKEENTLIIMGADARSVLYGVGWLLRKSAMWPGKMMVPSAITVSSTPRYTIRGHQLGYRPKTNSYDAFSVAQFDQYIRELALFGANSIEIVPPRTDDDPTSRHMKLPPIKMIAEQSRICKEYGLDVWMWYPNMGSDYSRADSIRAELAERRQVFAAVPKLDDLFIPGADPGELEPDTLFAWLEKVAVVLHEFHPNARIWVSPQVFKPTQKWVDAFYEQINHGYPWLGGIVYGPWIKTPLAEIRARVKSSIPIRIYPDITHSLSSQYPIPNWDLAYAMTLGRECVNPRPDDEKHIHNLFAPYSAGSISYSEGTNDDVNKIVWSGQDWDPETPVMETLRDYARLFIGPDFTEQVARGILSLEKNLRGPLLTNESVPRTLSLWQEIEDQTRATVHTNFRLQMCVLRAYYDAYIQKRLIHETALEQEAKDVLGEATVMGAGALPAIERVRAIFAKVVKEPVNPGYKRKCLELADSLFASIGAQLTIEKHGAVGGRGNFIDNIEAPLNDAPWILDQLDGIAKLGDESQRLARIRELLHRTDPGPGGIYDHFGPAGTWGQVLPGAGWKKDPAGYSSPAVAFGVGTMEDDWVHEIRPRGFGGRVAPRAWMEQIGTLYDQPLQIEYKDLDPDASYRIRLSYTGRFRSTMKLTADGLTVHDFIATGEKPLYEFDVPRAATADGRVRFTWTCLEGDQGPQVAEIWLIRK
ncbi:MAG: hypothetical protein P4L51_00595 [Puia sp.]|nr:hypothetical protein [Puia sp.]